MSVRIVFAVIVGPCLAAELRADSNLRVDPVKSGGISIHRPGDDPPLLVFNAPEGGRPYVHPLLAPDGKGALTEYSPGHHKHQTGIYVGFLKVNGRDYFHNRGEDYFRRTGFKHIATSEGVTWQSAYELLDAQKSPQLLETQAWHFRDFGTTFLIDLAWKADARVDLVFGKHEYGGLFMRMPYKGKPDSQAINSEGQVNGKAEGKKARWVDVGMPIAGRADLGHIAVLSHEKNPQAPLPWRVDGQLGVGPAPSRSGAWKLAKGESVTFRYRFLVYTGAFNQKQVEDEWKAFSAIK